MKGLHLFGPSNLFSSVEQSVAMLPSEVSPMWDVVNWQLAYQEQLYHQRLSLYHHPVIMSRLKQSDKMAGLYVQLFCILNIIIYSSFTTNTISFHFA